MRDVIYFSSIPWSYFHHRQQEMCRCLAIHGYRVFFIEPVQKGTAAAGAISSPEPGIVAVRPEGLPYERVLRAVNIINSRKSARLLADLVERYGIKNPVCILDRVHGVDLGHVHRLGPVVCDLIDEITAFGRMKNKAMLKGLEKKAIGMSAALFSSSMTLGRRKQAYSHNGFVFLPNGISDSAFVEKASPDRNERPTAGFVGTISARSIDFNLINDVAKRLPSWDFRLIGPMANDMGDIGSLAPNVRIEGPVVAEDVPCTIAGFDVGLIPYRHEDEGMDYVFPKKLFEYFAVGIPVVSTGLAECKAYSDLIGIADTADAFVDSIEFVFATDSPDKRADRVAEARESSWDNLLETKMIPILESLVGEDPECRA